MNFRNLSLSFALCFLFLACAGALKAQTITPPGEETGRLTSTKLPVCAPPQTGIWWVFEDCVMTAGPSGTRTAPSHVRVLPGVTLRVAPGATLDVDFANFNLRIGDGSRVIIAEGASIR